MKSLFKMLFKEHSFQKPIYLLITLLATYLVLHDLGYWIGYFLRHPSTESYKDIIVQYDGLTTLLVEAFRKREDFFDLKYIVTRYQSVAILGLVILLGFIFRARIISQITPGKFRDIVLRVSAFMERPSLPIFYIFLIIILYSVNIFFKNLHYSYEIGINALLAQKINTYSDQRLDNFLNQQDQPVIIKKEKSAIPSRQDLRKPLCVFYSKPKNIKIFKISYADFLVNILFPNNKQIQKIENIIEELPLNIRLHFDDSILRTLKINLSDETYSKAEVLHILRQVEENRKIQIEMNEIKNPTTSLSELGDKEGFLLVSALESFYLLSYANKNQILELGQISLLCSESSDELINFKYTELLNSFVN